MPSFKPEVMVAGESSFNGNSLRFATEGEAQTYVADLQRRWLLVVDTRVVQSDDPVNYEVVDGVIRALPEGHQVHEVQP